MSRSLFLSPLTHTRMHARTHTHTLSPQSLHPFPSLPHHTVLVEMKILTSEGEITDSPVKVTEAQWDAIGSAHASWLVELGGIDGSGFLGE